MGIFNFVANAGKRLLGRGDEVKPADSAAAIKKEIGVTGITRKDNPRGGQY